MSFLGERQPCLKVLVSKGSQLCMRVEESRLDAMTRIRAQLHCAALDIMEIFTTRAVNAGNMPVRKLIIRTREWELQLSICHPYLTQKFSENVQLKTKIDMIGHESGDWRAPLLRKGILSGRKTPVYKMALAHGDLSADLLVKNLPRQFTDSDKESLLQYFGAKHVVCMGARGKMVRHCPFLSHFSTKIRQKYKNI